MMNIWLRSSPQTSPKLPAFKSHQNKVLSMFPTPLLPGACPWLFFPHPFPPPTLFSPTGMPLLTLRDPTRLGSQGTKGSNSLSWANPLIQWISSAPHRPSCFFLSSSLFHCPQMSSKKHLDLCCEILPAWSQECTRSAGRKQTHSGPGTLSSNIFISIEFAPRSVLGETWFFLQQRITEQ